MVACTVLAVQEEQPAYMSLLHEANTKMEERHLKDEKAVPSSGGLKGMGVRGLQAWIEYAWEQGMPHCFKNTQLQGIILHSRV